MGDDSDETLATPPRSMHTIAPKARSLLVHGIFAKPATKVGMVATKAAFLLRQFLQIEVPVPPVVDRLLSKAEAKEKQAEATKKKKDAKELIQLVRHSNEVLAQVTTPFPFTLFPDTVTVDRHKVTIHRRNFFFTSETVGIKIKDILNVSCSLGPIFGTVVITIVMTGDKIHVKSFWRKDAIFLKHILQGSVIAASNNTDTDSLSREELIATLTEIGHDGNS